MEKKVKLIRKIEEFEKLDTSSSINDIKDLLSQIMKGYKCYTRIIDSHYCFRGRINKKNVPFEKTSELYYPPAKNVTSMGRMNRTKTSIFYISASHETATLEIRPSVGDIITIMRYKLKNLSRKPHVMELGVAETNSQYNLDGNTNIIENTKGRVVFQDTEEMKCNILIRNLLAKELMKIVPQGSENEYRKSIAIFETLTVSEEIDGLLFPSIAGDGTRSGGGTNMALKPKAADILFDPDHTWMSKVINVHGTYGYEMECVRNAQKINDENIIWE